jgi:hypothetical protein
MRKNMRAAIAAMLLLASSPAMATGSTAGFEKGGRFMYFDPVIARYNLSGELFRIDGICKSACTTFLSIRNVCVTKGATFYFHAGHDTSRHITASATNHMLSTYNDRLGSYIMANHYMDTLEFHAISGRDMIEKFGYRECSRRSHP